MQASKPYSKEHAEALLLPCGEGGRWVIDERGVQPAVMNYKDAERLGLVPEYKLLSWKPVMAFQDDQNAPDCKDTPALPFPFDARDLAAFMLDGVGAFVADYYGDWEDGPETESLNDIDPSNNYARRAVREAFDAYRQAVKSVGEPDNGDTWRDAMVRELLTPKVAPEPAAVEALPVQPKAAAPAPVVAESGSKAVVVPFKKAALIAAHVHEWPTIERDIADANTNGLAAAAKASARGWFEDAALMWARANGKLISAVKPADSLAQAMHNLGSLPHRKHTIQG